MELETLTCPITLELFRDPVIAGDGHTYERKAIIKWLNMYGTSPLTRQPLNVTELQPDEHLKLLSAQRRLSTTSDLSQDSTVTVPLMSENNIDNTHPSDDVVNPRTSAISSSKDEYYVQCFCIILFVIWLATVVLVTAIRLTHSAQTNATVTTTTPSSY